VEEELSIAKREKVGLAILAGIFILGILIFSLFLGRQLSSPKTLEEPKTIVVQPKMGFIEISNLLATEGLIARPAPFRIYVLFRGWATSLKSGRYTFSDSVSVPQIARRLVSGPGDVEVTIPEGLTLEETDKRIAGFGIADAGEILEISQRPLDFNYPFLEDSEIATLEGFLFPDTYRFNQRMTPEEIVKKMLDNFNQKVWLKMNLGAFQDAQSFYPILIMASILERETAGATDRRIIADILWRRLEKEIPLQVDATVVYAWKQLNPAWRPKNHNLSEADIKINSPYNTYRFRGLPPRPIANPGLAAIQAALEPIASDYWYYLSAPNGETIFSRTLEEHLAAKEKYLKQE